MLPGPMLVYQRKRIRRNRPIIVNNKQLLNRHTNWFIYFMYLAIYLITKRKPDIENCRTPSLSLLRVSKLSCLVYEPFTSFASLLKQAATMDGRRLMQNIPSSGFIFTVTLCSAFHFPLFLISRLYCSHQRRQMSLSFL